jgi:hypothetical protein
MKKSLILFSFFSTTINNILASAAAQNGYYSDNCAILGKDNCQAFLKFFLLQYLSKIILNTYILFGIESFLSSEKNLR